MNLSGRCLCGQVTIELTEVHPQVTACHCSMCQKFHGGPFLALAACSRNQITFTGESLIQRYNSSNWAQRGFCRQCGSSLFYYAQETAEFFFATGLFQELTEAVFTEEIYTKDQPPFYHFAERTRRWPELPSS
ncbi:GFA family protein [Enterococcus gallinarum]|uniref:GFA family protein n=1 Tax=Enterococcus gallinarum TaxID=1353 RepID=UPI003D6C0853